MSTIILTNFGPATEEIENIINRGQELSYEECERMAEASNELPDAEFDAAYQAFTEALEKQAPVEGMLILTNLINEGHPHFEEDDIDLFLGIPAMLPLVRDALSLEHYNLLMTPWRAGVGQ